MKEEGYWKLIAKADGVKRKNDKYVWMMKLNNVTSEGKVVNYSGMPTHIQTNKYCYKKPEKT